LPPCEPPPPLCPPGLGIDGALAPPPPEAPPEGIPELPPLDPELPPLGMLELDPPPELPEEPPDEPDEPPDDGLGIDGEGMLLEEEDWSTQPPIRNADVALTRAVCDAMTTSRRRGRRKLGRLDIA
jgi:hypothetical protein